MLPAYLESVLVSAVMNAVEGTLDRVLLLEACLKSQPPACLGSVLASKPASRLSIVLCIASWSQASPFIVMSGDQQLDFKATPYICAAGWPTGVQGVCSGSGADRRPGAVWAARHVCGGLQGLLAPAQHLQGQ